MRVFRALLLLATAATSSNAHSYAAQEIFTSEHLHEPVDTLGQLPRPRIAIIGGGAGGTSAAYFLKHLSNEDPSLAVDVDLFEANDYLGGRSTVIRPFDDERYPAVETGASIFVTVNKNLVKAVSQFNLTLQDAHGGDEEDAGGISIWNGERFVYKESTWAGGYWNVVKLAWRYGLSPLTVRNTVKATVDKFVLLYGAEAQSKGPHESIASFANSLGLDGLADASTLDYLRKMGVTDAFVQDLVGAATRVNYGQNPSGMQAFQGMVSMAASGASSVVGGNRRIFQNFAKHSGARIHLDTQVRSIRKLEEWDAALQPETRSRPWLLKYQNTRSGIRSVQFYDAVIFAAPMHPQSPATVSAIDFIGSDIPSLIPPLSYVHLCVTVVVTNATEPRSDYFGVKEKIPTTILSTFEPFVAGSSKTKPKINSLSYLRKLGRIDEESGDGHVVKLFSENKLTDSDLQEIFGPRELLWVYRKAWPAYPISPPFSETEDLPSFKPDNTSTFYYVSAMERWVSTMETETVSAWNAVALLMRDLFGYKVEKSWAEWDVPAL